MEDEDAHEDGKRGNQVHVITGFDLLREIESVPKRTLKHRHSRGDESHCEGVIVPRDQLHRSPRSLRRSSLVARRHPIYRRERQGPL